MTTAASRYADAGDPAPQNDADDIGRWCVTVSATTRFEYIGGSTANAAIGPGLKEFDSFVRRFAPSGYDDDRIRGLVEHHLRGTSSIVYRAGSDVDDGILVGASYKTTIDEVLGAVWGGCCAAIAHAARQAGVTGRIDVRSDHPTAEFVAEILGATVTESRTAFLDSMQCVLDDVAKVVSHD